MNAFGSLNTTGSTGRQSISNSQDLGDSQDQRSLSRHVSSVISHFTASKDGTNRLLNEIDDIIFAVSPSMNILYVTPSCSKLLGHTQEDLLDKSLSMILMEEDVGFCSQYVTNSILQKTEFVFYCRFVSKPKSPMLFEVRGKASVHRSENKVAPEDIIILAAREYKSKATISLDSILELQLENRALKARLESRLLKKGLDPLKNPFLKELTSHNDYNVDFVGLLMANDRPGGDDIDALLRPSPVGSTPLSAYSTKNHLPTDLDSFSADTEKKKKRKKVKPEDLFCLQCGTTKSPEWRTGPEGPKTLCNACGLAYYKKNKKMMQQPQ